MPRPCPCTNLLIIPKRDRTITFVSELADHMDIPTKPDVIFSSSAPERSRHGRARVVCACEPGYTRIGASTAVLYGKNDSKLWDAFQAVPDPIVLVLLYEGTRYTSGRLQAIRDACVQTGRECHAFRFVETCTVHVQPLLVGPKLKLTARHVQKPEGVVPSEWRRDTN